MQASLFEEEIESVDDVNRDLLETAEGLYPGKIFIFGRGRTNADVLVVGESPGPQDRATGKPFSGPAGDLLFRILRSINLDPAECYLTNIVKFISQGDEITPAVLSFFAPYLRREILAVRPRLIISLGNSSTRELLRTKKAISAIRGEVYDFDGIPVVPTFNPAYLMRDATKKKEVWDDMKTARRILDNNI